MVSTLTGRMIDQARVGVLLYIRENIPHRRSTQYESDCDFIEIICMKIKIIQVCNARHIQTSPCFRRCLMST